MRWARYACLPVVICLTLLGLPLLSHGQDDPPSEERFQGAEKLLLHEVPSVYSASKYEQKVTEAPSSVSIVTADEIKKFGYRTLADIIRSVRGFHVTYDRNYSYVGVRGFAPPGDYNTRLLLLVDGHRVNDNVYDMAFVGTEFVLDVDLIERVEIVRGPSSSRKHWRVFSSRSSSKPSACSTTPMSWRVTLPKRSRPCRRPGKRRPTCFSPSGPWQHNDSSKRCWDLPPLPGSF